MAKAIKLSDELVESAREQSRLWSRSMTQQIEHWARIGRALERQKDVSLERVRAALQADLDYDMLNDEERVVVLGELERTVFQPDGDRALARQLRQRQGELAELVDGALVATSQEGSRPIQNVDEWAERRAKQKP